MKVTVLGSCVSRVSLLRGNTKEHGIIDGCKHARSKGGLELEYFLDKHNIALAMCPPPFAEEEVNTITSQELWDKSRDVSLRQLLMKQTVPLLMDGESEYLIMDFYDFHNNFLAYKDTAFATGANEFMNTGLFRKYAEQLTSYTFFQLPTWTYYPLVDLFFERIMQKYDADHIILNRFRANTFYLDVDGKIKLIPENFKQPFQCHDKRNPECRRLEEYVINKHHPYVIDVSKYFMGDRNLWDNLNASHFEKEFYRETYDQIIRIIEGETAERYFDTVQVFDRNRPGYDEDMKRKFDVEYGIKFFEALLEESNGLSELGLNVLDKLYAYAPEDKNVNRYMEMLF